MVQFPTRIAFRGANPRSPPVSIPRQNVAESSGTPTRVGVALNGDEQFCTFRPAGAGWETFCYFLAHPTTVSTVGELSAHRRAVGVGCRCYACFNVGLTGNYPIFFNFSSLVLTVRNTLRR